MIAVGNNSTEGGGNVTLTQPINIVYICVHRSTPICKLKNIMDNNYNNFPTFHWRYNNNKVEVWMQANNYPTDIDIVVLQNSNRFWKVGNLEMRVNDADLLGELENIE